MKEENFGIIIALICIGVLLFAAVFPDAFSVFHITPTPTPTPTLTPTLTITPTMTITPTFLP